MAYDTLNDKEKTMAKIGELKLENDRLKEELITLQTDESGQELT